MREGERERESETMRLYTTNDRVSEHRNCTHARTGSCTNTYCTHTSAVTPSLCSSGQRIALHAVRFQYMQMKFKPLSTVINNNMQREKEKEREI